VILIGVGTGNDDSVTGSVDLVRKSTNFPFDELHDPHRLSAPDIVNFIANSEHNRVVFVSHGGPNFLVDATSNRSPYFGAGDITNVHGCYIFSHACLSGLGLGQSAVSTSLLFLGFDTSISAPPEPTSPCYGEVRDIYVGILAFLGGVTYKNAVDTSEECREFLNDLRVISEYSQSIFDTPGGSTLGADDLICLRQFGSDACCWIRGRDDVVKADGAPLRLTSLW
jgi:hypothetical protein